MKKTLLAVALLFASLAVQAECYPSAAVGPNSTLSAPCVTVPSYINAAGKAVALTAGDVCQNPAFPKSSVALNVSTATTTSLVAVSGSKAIYVCSVDFTTGGTNPTYKFEYGTTTSGACDTGTTALTGALAPTSGTSVFLNNQGTLMQTTAGQALCLVTTGTGPVAVGFLTYVQQ